MSSEAERHVNPVRIEDPSEMTVYNRCSGHTRAVQLGRIPNAMLLKSNPRFYYAVEDDLTKGLALEEDSLLLDSDAS